MSLFYFALTNPEAEALLKEEIKTQFPELRPSYSRSGFLTFKGEKDGIFAPWFARVSGKMRGRFTYPELKFSKAWVWKGDSKLAIPHDLQHLSDRSLFKIGEMVTLIMMMGEDEYWVGEYKLLPTHFQTPGEVSSIEEREDLPSRAYYKMAEAFEAFDLPFDHQEIILELGSAPGGASLFLLEQDFKVLGVDTAAMAPAVLKDFNFKHLRRPFETLEASHFPQGVDWIVSDINLPPTVIMKELRRLLSFLEPRGIILTLKMNQSKHLSVMGDILSEVKKLGFSEVHLKYLPSHRQEICLYAHRS